MAGSMLMMSAATMPTTIRKKSKLKEKVPTKYKYKGKRVYAVVDALDHLGYVKGGQFVELPVWQELEVEK